MTTLPLNEYVVLFLRNLGVDMTPRGERSSSMEVVEKTGAYAIQLVGHHAKSDSSYRTNVYAYPDTRKLFVNVASNQDWWEFQDNTPMNPVEMCFKKHGFIGQDGESWTVELI